MEPRIVSQLPGKSRRYPPITDKLLARVVKHIRAAGSPVKIVLFGSRARGDYKPDSDIDILVLEATEQLCNQKRFAYRQAVRGVYPDCTVLTYSLAETEKWKYVPNQFISQVLSYGLVLYEDEGRMCEIRSTSLAGGLVAEDSEEKDNAAEREYGTQFDLTRDWLKRAENDLATARRELKSDNAAFEIVCFHVQQAIEKYFKALLALHGNAIERTHDLEHLAQQCHQMVAMPVELKSQLRRLTEYGVSARYDLTFWPSRETAEEAVDIAGEVLALLRPQFPPEAQP